MLDEVVRWLLRMGWSRTSSVRLLHDLALAMTSTQPVRAHDRLVVPKRKHAFALEGSFVVGDADAGHALCAGESCAVPESTTICPAAGDGVVGIADPDDAVPVARRASYALDRSLATPGTSPIATHHAMWLCGSPGTASLGDVAQLLGAGIATRFGDTVLVGAVSPGRIRLQAWNAARGVFAAASDVVMDDGDTLRMPGRPDERPVHVILHPAGPPTGAPVLEPPPPFTSLRFHRVIELRGDLPESVPAPLVQRLRPEAVDAVHGPLFASYVAALHRDASVQQSRFRDRALDGDHGSGVARRIHRDHLDLGCAPAEIARLRHGVPVAGDEDPLLRVIRRRRPDLLARAGSWGASLTNRSVGMALGGGGASCFRIARVLQELHRAPPDQRILPDVTIGVSGGALVGAYHAVDPEHGIDRLAEGCWRLAPVSALSIFFTDAIARFVSYDLGGAHTGALETRFASLALVLNGLRGPATCVVESGTLGQLVQASGSPPVISRSVFGGRRYFDGACGLVSPARALWSMGADFVVGLNAVPAPSSADPLEVDALTGLALRWTPLGRIVDATTLQALMLQRLNQDSAKDSHVHYDPDPVDFPFVEMFRWWDAGEILRHAGEQPAFHTKVQAIRDDWARFRRYGSVTPPAPGAP